MSIDTDIRNDTGAAPARQGRTSGQLLSLLVSMVLIAVILVAPGVWQWTTAEHGAVEKARNIVEQIGTVTAGPSDPTLVGRLREAPAGTQAAPIILTYHNVSETPGQYSVTPAAFAAQMQLLADAGWTTVTAAQLHDWLAGKPLPPHSVMITFDDGVRGVWQYADQILARNHQQATAYIITGFVGTSAPYYLTWPEITALHASGRWDIQAHTHLGHGQIPTDAAGGQGPFLTSLRWLADQQRVETIDEYRARITADLVECKRQLANHGFGDAEFFAYPFSAHADTPATTATLAATVGSLFRAAMLDSAGEPITTTTGDLSGGNLARMDITSDVTLPGWVDKIRAVSPRDPAGAAPLAHAQDWTSNDGTVSGLPVQDGRDVALDPGPGAYTARVYAPTGSSMWRSYQVSAILGGFRQVDDGATTGLMVLSNDPQQVELTLNTGSYQIRQGLGPDERLLAQGVLVPASSYPVLIAVRPDGVGISVAGRRIADIALRPVAGRPPAGGIAITANRHDVDSPIPTVSGLDTR